MNGSSYCSDHTCQAGRTSCKNSVAGANAKCDSCKNKEKSALKSTSKSSYSSKNTTKTSSSKKSSSSKKKYDYNMPDCDDYEDWDDFMDDWDGCMPDGSDASDYWDNW